jgi:hypothetical protein
MRHLRPFTAFFAIAAIAVACSSASPGASTGGGQSQGPGASTGGGGGGGASQPAASTGGGGGGGGGGGVNGSIHYEITGDATKSGDLDFFANAGVSQFLNGGWVAYFYTDSDPNKVIQINSNPASNIFNYGDGEILVIGVEDVGCTFNYSRNDAGGLKGTIDCPTVIASNATSGAQIHVQVHATVDAHT